MFIVAALVSLNKHFVCKSLEFASLREDFLIFFCNKVPSKRSSCPHYYFIFLFGYKLSVFNQIPTS